MLSEIAITPSVFQSDGYTSPEECDAHLCGIRQDILEYCLIRDLRDGDWYRQLNGSKSKCPHMGQKLLKQLRVTSRLRRFANKLSHDPESSSDWCLEALETHEVEALTGILTCKKIKKEHQSEALITSINQRHSSKWWSKLAAGGAARIGRNTKSYLERFGIVFRNASHIIFRDPHLDPERGDYREFPLLLERCSIGATVEIHRVVYEGVKQRDLVDAKEWERRFNSKLGKMVSLRQLKVNVFIWPDEHDRHLLTNLMSYHLGNGLTVTTSKTAKMTCSRLSRAQSDEIQREIDPGVNSPSYSFKIGS